jgi:hypothetical protein
MYSRWIDIDEAVLGRLKADRGALAGAGPSGAGAAGAARPGQGELTAQLTEAEEP